MGHRSYLLLPRDLVTVYSDARKLVFLLVPIGSVGVYCIFGFCRHSTSLGDREEKLWALIGGADHPECEGSLSPAQELKGLMGMPIYLSGKGLEPNELHGGNGRDWPGKETHRLRM